MRLSPRTLVALLFFTGTASYICRVNTSVAGALMMRDLGFSQIEMGRIFSAFIFGYALFQIPAGAAADRCGTRRVLAWAACSWVLVTLLISLLGLGPIGGGIAHALTPLLILRFILGVGESPTFPAAAQGISEWISRPRQGFASGIVLTSVGAGSAIAPVLISTVMVRWGWRAALVASTAPAIAVALGWAISRPPSSELAPQREPQDSKVKAPIVWSRSFILLIVSYTIEGYVGYIFLFWFYLYLVEVRHFDLLRAGSLSSLPGLLSIVSIPLGGLISDRLITSRLGVRWGRRAVPMTGLILSGILLTLGAGTGNANYAVMYLALAMASVLAVEGPFWATMIEIAGPRSGTAGGIMNCGSNIGGMISPALTPLLAAHIGWNNALYLAAALAIVGAFLWLGISPQSLSTVRPSLQPC
jgi:ACS family glucarate transporter-like MFS transporter